MKEKRVKITFCVSPENANKLRAFNVMLENNIDFNTMKETSEFAIRVSQKSNNEFVKAIQNTEQLKQHKEFIETNKPKFGISAEEFLKTINPTGDKLSPTIAKNARVEKIAEIDYTEWQNCPEMRNIYDEIDYNMARGYIPLTRENAEFVMNEGKDLYQKLKRDFYSPGFDINRIMTEIYNLWKETRENA